MEKVRLDFDRAELKALAQRAERTLRSVPQEARYIIREALQQDGLLAGSDRAERAERANG